MSELELPWIELMILCPIAAALWIQRLNDPDRARRHSLVACTLTFVFALGAWIDYSMLDGLEDHDRWDLVAQLVGRPLLVIDGLSAPLLPLVSLLYLLTVLATLGTKVRRLSYGALHMGQAIRLATFSCMETWPLIILLTVGIIPSAVELIRQRKSVRIYLLHMVLFVTMLIGGQLLLDGAALESTTYIVAVALLLGAVLVRSGIVPVHCWMTDLFEHASFGTALLYVTPMVGAYAAMRLVLPIAPDWALRGIAVLSLATALYAAGMALVQRDARRFFCYIFLSHSSLVFVGLETVTVIGLTGALCLWLAVALSMTGFGLTLRSLEARTGRLSLDTFHGLYEHTPGLASLFLVTGLASIGFPGTVGFIGAELLVDGAVQLYPLVGIAIVLAAALNGLAVLHIYFRVFTGTRHPASIDLQVRLPERIAVLVLTALIVGGGLYPQPGVASRYAVANQLVQSREERFGTPASPPHGAPQGVQALAPHWR
jgi:NADH:ubiquinone oxidoreductase subunit 4 (subunit M)